MRLVLPLLFLLSAGCGDPEPPPALGFEATAEAYHDRLASEEGSPWIRYGVSRRGEFYVVDRPDDDGPGYYVELPDGPVGAVRVTRAGDPVADSALVRELASVAAAFERSGVYAVLGGEGGGAFVLVSPRDILIYTGPSSDSLRSDLDVRRVARGWYYSQLEGPYGGV